MPSRNRKSTKSSRQPSKSSTPLSLTPALQPLQLPLGGDELPYERARIEGEQGLLSLGPLSPLSPAFQPPASPFQGTSSPGFASPPPSLAPHLDGDFADFANWYPTDPSSGDNADVILGGGDDTGRALHFSEGGPSFEVGIGEIPGTKEISEPLSPRDEDQRLIDMDGELSLPRTPNKTTGSTPMRLQADTVPLSPPSSASPPPVSVPVPVPKSLAPKSPTRHTPPKFSPGPSLPVWPKSQASSPIVPSTRPVTQVPSAPAPSVSAPSVSVPPASVRVSPPAPVRLTTPTSPSAQQVSNPTRRRYPAPSAFTQLSSAPAVVDLGVGRGYGGGYTSNRGGEDDPHGPRKVGGSIGRSRKVDHEVDKGYGAPQLPRPVDGAHRGHGEAVWTRWDRVETRRLGLGPQTLGRGDGTGETVLLTVGYRGGVVRVWDCLTVMSEGAGAGLWVDIDVGVEVVWGGVLPDNVLEEKGVQLGVLCADATLVLYSLEGCGHRSEAPDRMGAGQIKRETRRIELGKDIQGTPVSFEVGANLLVLSTANPANIYVLSAATLEVLWHLPPTALVSFGHPSNSHGNQGGNPAEYANSYYGRGALAAAHAVLAGAGGVHKAWYGQEPEYEPELGREYGHEQQAPRLGHGFRRRAIRDAQHHYQEHERKTSQQLHHEQYQERHPAPVFALSHRLLAYASPLPPRNSAERGQAEASTSNMSGGVGTSSGAEVGVGLGKGLGMGLGKGTGLVLPTTQAELGSAALRVGGSVLSGMRALGGMAVSAARNRVASGSTGTSAGISGRFFSRSAPTGGEEDLDRERERERRYSGTGTAGSSSVSGSPGGSVEGEGGVVGRYLQRLGGAGGAEGGGCCITVVDLAPLLGTMREPVRMAEWEVARDRRVAGMSFSADGCQVVVAPGDGQVMEVFQVRPVPVGGGVEREKESEAQALPWRVYELKRGRTSAVIEGTEWAGDGRWVAIGTRKRTVHVFPVNPYGGKPDHKSHLDGRVRNVKELQPMPIEVSPVVRLRVPKYSGLEETKAPLAFTFIKSTEATLPSSLLPAVMSSPVPSVVSDTSSSSPPSHPRGARRRPTNFQDMLLFDPADGTLSLRRCTVELRPREQGIAAAALGVTSISLPGMGGAGRLGSGGSTSPGTSMGTVAGGGGHARSASRSRSGVAQMMEATQPVPMELVGRESVVATWNLQKAGGEGRKSMERRGSLEQGKGRGGLEKPRKVDWLAQAELSTSSRSPQILPRSIYLSHQFSFHTLGEDYHALIRQYQLDICGAKIDVRKEVQVSAYPAGSGESFVEGLPSPRDIRGRTLSSSFDEPLASALAAGLDHPHTSSILPMFPNGTPGAKPQSFRHSIPIRAVTGIGDGMSESLGRIRREINKARSPRLRPRPDSSMSASVPLEFDEEDEDFLTRDELDVPPLDRDGSRDTSLGGADSGASVATPVTNAVPSINDGDDDISNADDTWTGWSPEDKAAVEEAEKFDDISVVGFLDEEQAPVVPVVTQKRKGRGRRR